MESTTTEKQLTDNKIASLLDNAKQAIIAGDSAAAERYADEALSLNAEHSDAYYWKGAALLGRKKYGKAMSALTEAVVLNELRTDYFALLALAYLRAAKAESANLIANPGLALQPDDLACLEVKTLSLIALFRLQEAHVALHQVLQLRSQGVAARQPAFITEDIEALYEQALTIDPFKTKSRLDNLNTIKLKHPVYRLLRKITLVDRSKAFTGFLVLISLIIAVSYFFRDDATYRSFSPLIFMFLWRGLAKERPVNVATNFRFLFTKKFSTAVQKPDTALTVGATALYTTTFAAFYLWHSAHSWIALTGSIICALLFLGLEYSFVPGNKRTTITFWSSRRKKHSTSTTVLSPDEVPYEYLYRIGMHAGASRVVNRLTNTRRVGFGLLVILLFPLCFLLVRAFTDAIPYTILLYVEMAAFIYILFVMSVFELFNLKIFYPSAVREFIPASHLRTGIYFYILWVLLGACIGAHFWTHDPYMLPGAGVTMAVMIAITIRMMMKRRVYAKRIADSQDMEKRERLVAYLKANVLNATPSSVNEGSRRL